MVRRIHPRHCTEGVTLRPYTEDPTTWVGTYGAPVQLGAAQVEHTRQIVVDASGVRVATVLTIRVMPAPDGTAPTAAPGSEVTFEGSSSWVLAVRPITRHGDLVYLELTTGEQPPRAVGGVEVVAVLHSSGGYDRKGDPLPATDTPLPVAVLVPRTTEEPVDGAQSKVTTADLFVPLSVTVASTDRVSVTDPAYVAGMWQVDGDPAPDGARLRVPLRHT